MSRKDCWLFLVILLVSIPGGAVAQAADIVKQPPASFTYWVAHNLRQHEVVSSWNEIRAVQELEHKTGVRILYRHPTIGHEVQSFHQMLSSGDLPDMIQEREGTLYYPGGPDQAMADGMYLELTGLIDRHAPNYLAWLKKNPAAARLTVTDSGKRWGMYHVTETTEPTWSGYAIRKDWLESLRLATPVTLDDWYQVLKAFKEKKKVSLPLLIPPSGIPVSSQILSAFDIGGGFYQVNGRVKYGPIEPAFREYLALMVRWYREGLIDPDFMGRMESEFETNAPTHLITSGKAGLLPMVWGRTAAFYQTQGGGEPQPGLWLQPLSAPKKTAGQQIHFNSPVYQVRSAVAITKACKDPVAAVKWLDQLYSVEGSLTLNYGVRGETYTMKDGKAVFTDQVTHPATGTPVQALYKSVRWDGPGIVDFGRLGQLYAASGLGESVRAYEIWAKDDSQYVMPPVTLSRAESIQFSNVMQIITDFVTEKTVKFITENEPLSELETFRQQLRHLGIDRALVIQQSALERFNARKLDP